MNRVPRLLALAGAGIGVAASVAVGTAPAQAAAQTGTHSATAQVKGHYDDDDDDFRVVHVFDSPRQCVRVGRIGEFRGEWDEWACFRVRDNHDGMRIRSSRYDGRYSSLSRNSVRHRDSDYALVVSEDDDCDWDDYDNGGLFSGRYWRD
jgi:hypothetical protein